MKILIFKPDGIGDFVLACGAIRYLADQFGESALTLVVRDNTASLAASQFPQSQIFILPWQNERRILNLFVANTLHLIHPLRSLRETRFDWAVSLRNMRNYLQNTFFFACRADRFIASENLLARNRRWGRLVVEGAIDILRRPYWTAYPEVSEGIPTEVESHRRLLSRMGKPVPSLQEVLPKLKSHASQSDYIACAPMSVQSSKDFAFASWIDAMLVAGISKKQDLRLCGSPDQKDRLKQFASSLYQAGFSSVSVVTDLSLPSFVDLIAGARMVWSVDTAAAHIAIACERPCMILFSGMHKGAFGPWSRCAHQVWIQTGKKQVGADGKNEKVFDADETGRVMKKLGGDA